MFKTNDIEKLLSITDCFEKPTFSISGELNDNIDKLILSDLWPNEVPPAMIVKNDRQVAVRAKSIAHSHSLPTMCGKKFLDFGCGNGSVVIEAFKMGLLAYGYDMTKQWPDDIAIQDDITIQDNAGTFNVSTDIDYIITNGPYDIISVYDVVDHIMTHEEAVNAMSSIRKCSTPNTIIKVRCHPWTSRHGGHLYETINKAYAHILLSEEEYEKHTTVKVRKITRPLAEYGKIFEKAGLGVMRCDKSQIPMDNIFLSEPLIKAFNKRLSGDASWQSQVLPMTFIDYTLSTKQC